MTGQKKTAINYVCEVNYPNSSAYGIHVLKMCDALKNKHTVINLFAPSITLSDYNLKKKYKINNTINFISVFKKIISLNFFTRAIFSLKILMKNNLNYKEFEKHFYLSRSVVFALFGCILNKKVILEIHHELSGITKIIFFLIKKLGFLKNLKYIFIHKNLNKIFKIPKGSYICLDDAVNIKDFKNIKNTVKKNTCVYVGSFHKGKGVEKIFEIAKRVKNVNFHLYGDKTFLKKNLKLKNVKIFNFIPYRYIPDVLSKYDVALMPYENYVSGRLKNINLVNYMSPLKMFDYLASSKIILASDLKVYKHILRNKFNSILIDYKTENWVNWINSVFKSKKKFFYLKKNAKKTALKFTWERRSKKILTFSKKLYL